MSEIKKLILALEHAMPNLNAQILNAHLSKTIDSDDMLSWLYEELSAQRLMEYIEWKEYFGEIPDLEILDNVYFSESPNDLIFAQLEDVDWDDSTKDYYALPYQLPFLEHINFYLTEFDLRLVDFANCENGYIFCIRNDESVIEELNNALSIFDLQINTRAPMDRVETERYIRELIN